MRSARVKILLVGLSTLLLTSPDTTASAIRQVRPFVYEPAPSDSLRLIYVDGQPVALNLNPDLPVVLQMQFEHLNGEQYLKAWAFVLNRSDRTLELVPQSQFSIEVLADSDNVVCQLAPQTPSTILAAVDSEKRSKEAGVLFAGILSGIAAAVGTRDTRISRVGVSSSAGTVGRLPFSGTSASADNVIVHDREDKLDAALGRTTDRVSRSLGILNSVYDTMKASISSVLLRRNTLDHGGAANGFIWFDYGSGREPAAQQRGITTFDRFESAKQIRGSKNLSLGEPEKWRYRIRLSIPGLSPVTAVFNPTPGE